MKKTGNTHNHHNKYMTAREIVDFIADGKTTIRTINDWRKRNLLKAIKKRPDGDWLYRIQDVYEFLR